MPFPFPTIRRAPVLLACLVLLALLGHAAAAGAMRLLEGASDRTGLVEIPPGGEGVIVSDFEPGHGFLGWFPTGTVVTDPAARRFGATGLRMTTHGDGPVAAEWRAPRPIDVRAARWRLRVRVDDPAALSELWLQVTSDDWESFVTYPLEGRVRPADAGAWLTLATMADEARVHGEPRLVAVDRVRLRANGRGVEPVEVHVDRLELVRHAPRAMVSITFDDGWASQARRALPIMERFGFAGTAFVVPYLIDAEGYVSEGDVEALRRAGWDVSGHYHPSLEGRVDPELSGILRTVRAWLGAGRGAGLFAYPQGYADGTTIVPAVGRRFDAARTIVHGLETLPPADPLRLRSFTVLPETRPAHVEDALARAAREGAWLILVFHRIVDEARTPTEVSVDAFEEILAVLAASDLPVRPMSEVLEAHPPPVP